MPANLAGVVDKLADPLGLNVSYVGDSAAAAEQLKVAGETFGAMVSRFSGVAGALAYMVLILLYTPCVAALGAIRHETGLGWAAFGAAWNTVLGYAASVTVYQVATFADAPATATLWLSLCAGIVVSAVFAMWLFGRAQVRRLAASMAAE